MPCLFLLRAATCLAVINLSLFTAFAGLEETDTSIGWENDDGELVWEFSFDPAAGKPYFHPLRVPGGPELTELRPEDHLWHYGMWFSLKYINGVNYWEETDGQAEGKTRWSPPRIEKLDDGRVSVTLRLKKLKAWRLYDLKLKRISSADGHPVLNPWIVYTVNHLLSDTPPPPKPIPQPRPERRIPKSPESGYQSIGEPQLD